MVSKTTLFRTLASLATFASFVTPYPTGTTNYTVSALQEVPNSGSVYQLSPANQKTSHAPVLLTQIPDIGGLLGITELKKDVFFIVGTNLLVGGTGCGVWKLDMRQFKMAKDGTVTRQPNLSLVTMVPSATLFNGVTRITGDNSHILVSDSVAGTITRVNVETGAYEITIQGAALQGPGERSIGVNGIHMHGNQLYFTNMDKAQFARVPISLSTGNATGPVEVIIDGTIADADDFAISKDGKKAWIATNGPLRFWEVDVSKKTARVAAESDLLSGTSAVAFGRTRYDQNDIYITSTASVSSNTTVGAVKVVQDIKF